MMNCVGNCLYGRKERTSAAGILLNVILVLFALILAAEIVFNSYYTGIYVINHSMTPTITGASIRGYDINGDPIAGSDGDYVFIRTGAKPTYEDIVVVKREYLSGGKTKTDNIIKRAVAFEGDKVEFIEGWLYVNGEKKEEDYISDKYRTRKDHKYYNYPVEEDEHIVAEGCVFLLGDNRNESDDSRANGDYKMSNVLGVVPEWSIKVKFFSSAWHRFFTFTIRGKSTTEIPLQNALRVA